MKYIRFYVAIILVCSVLSVVILPNTITSCVNFLERNFCDKLSDRLVGVADTVMFEGQDLVSHLSPAPIQAETLKGFTASFWEAFDGAHKAFDIFFGQICSGLRIATLNTGLGLLGWLRPNHPPAFGVWHLLTDWMALTTVGIIGVSFATSRQTTKQLKFLQTMATLVEKNGTFPVVKVEGSAAIKATAKALNAMSTSLKKAMDNKMRSIAAASHDLRTPMTRMRLRAEFLSGDDRAKWLRDLDEMERIADSAVQFVREESVDKTNENVRLDELVSYICGDLVQIGLSVKIVGLMQVDVELSPLALTRALRNLIINAATYGQGASVSVQHHGGRALVVIDDDGPGIPDQLLKRVFEPFFRVDSARLETIPGAGLGLAIAKEIIEKQSGILTIANRDPNGLRQILSFEVASRGEPLMRFAVPVH